MKNALDRLDNPAVFRLGIYVLAGIIGLIMVATGALDADSLADWVTSASTQAGGILALVAGLAGRNINAGAPKVNVDVADLSTVRDAVKDVLREKSGDTLTSLPSIEGTPLDELRRRITKER